MLEKAAVALYWDFENLHASLYDATHGNRAYSKNRYRAQDRMVEIEAVVRYASTFGDVVINRAYGNWQWFGKYRSDLLADAVELVQLFPPGDHAKNGADIRLALDALDDIIRLPYISHVIVVGGDSDYIGLSQKCRALGKTVIGIGVEESVNRFWARACTEFKLYRTLLGKVGSDSARVLSELQEENDVADARRLVITAMNSLALRAEDGWVVKAALKPMMNRLEPAFDESNYGFSSFSQFLLACDDLLEKKLGEHDHLYRLRSSAADSVETRRSAEQGEPSGSRSMTVPAGTTVSDYNQILVRGKIRLLEPEFRDRALREVYRAFQEAPENTLDGFETLIAIVSKRLRALSEPHQATDVTKLKHMLFRFRVFSLLRDAKGDAGIRLAGEYDSCEDFLRHVHASTAEWIARFGEPPIDIDAVGQLIFGPAVTPEQRALIQSALASHGAAALDPPPGH